MPTVPNLAPSKIRRLQFSEYSCCRHYVPAVSYAIHKYNKAANSTEINLKGLAIGNGLTDPAIQYGAYADFALLNNLVPKPVHDAMKLVSYIHLLTRKDSVSLRRRVASVIFLRHGDQNTIGLHPINAPPALLLFLIISHRTQR